jgi:hypothetical protein
MKFRKLLFVILFVSAFGSAIAQLNGNCPGCIINSAQFGSNITQYSVGLFPDSIVITQDDSVNIDVTYLLPQLDATGISIAPTATVTEVQILGINASTPLPTGISATCDQYAHSCAYYPQTYRYGCVKICGITAQAATNGWVLAQITVAGTGTAAGTTETQNQNINFYYKILPDTSVCHTVCFQNKIKSGCDSATLGIVAGADIACPNPILNPCSYDWAFGNGTVDTGLDISAVATPTPVTYSAPGTYPVTLTSYTNQLQITGASFTVPSDPLTLGFIPCTSGCPWYNNICNGSGINPSANNFSLDFSIGTSTYSTSGAGGGNLTGSFTGLNYPVSSQAVAISVHDACLATPLNSATATVLITGPGTYTWAAGSDATGSITVSSVPMDTFSYTDSVHIYASPDSPVITINKDSICNGDSTELNIGSAYAGYSILWYRDTVYLPNAAGDTAFYAYNSGSYHVKVTNPVTQCTAMSAPVTLAVSGGISQATTVYYSGGQLFLDPFLPGTSALWYFDSTLVTGQTGQFLTSLGNGNYYAVIYPTGFPFCTVTTNVVPVNINGIESTPDDVYNLSVFPNPNSGIFAVKVNVITPGTVGISLTDMLGRVVYENALVNISGEIKDNINVSGMAKGVYTLSVNTDKGKATKRVVVE